MPKCTIVGCRTGYKGQNKGLQTFQLPKSKHLRELWLKKINRENFTPSNHTVVCERHFRVIDCVPDHENLGYRGRPKKKRTLKPTAIPSKFLVPNIEYKTRRKYEEKIYSSNIQELQPCLIKILPKPETTAYDKNIEAFVKNENPFETEGSSIVIDHSFSLDHTVKYIRSKNEIECIVEANSESILDDNSKSILDNNPESFLKNSETMVQDDSESIVEEANLHCQKIELNVENGNPWSVSSAAEFLKYCCPECDFKTVELEGFSKHATIKHILSNLLFTNNSDDLSEFNEGIETKEEKENCDPINLGPDDTNSFESKPSTCTILVTPIVIRTAEPCMVKIMPKPQTTAYMKNNDFFVKNEQEKYEEDVSSRPHSTSPDHNEKSKIPCLNEKMSKKLVKIMPKPQTAASIRNIDVFVKNKEDPIKAKGSKSIDRFFSQDHTMKYIRSKKDCLDDQGFWICIKCPDTRKFNFIFELWNHWTSEHGTENPFDPNPNRFQDRIDWSNLVPSGKEIFERDQMFHQNGGWSCGQCTYSTDRNKFEHKFQMVTHWLENHSNNLTYEVCQYCCELFENPSQISHHHNSVHGEKFPRRIYNCNSCRTTHQDFHELVNHVKSKHEKDVELPFKCHVCPEGVYLIEEALYFHQKLEHNHKIDLFECKLCNRTFYSKASFLVHRKLLHDQEQLQSEISNDEPHFCQFCCHATESVSELIKHHKNYHELQRLPYFQCTECDYYSKLPTHTKEHLKTKHGIDDYKPYHCKQCDQKRGQVTTFYDHVKSHNDTKDFICDICCKPVKNRQTLVNHKAIFHANEPDLICDICGYKTNTSFYLQRHKRRVHAKNKECQYCGKLFGIQGNIEAHIENNHPGTSEKKYFCTECGESFMFQSSLTLHAWWHKKGKTTMLPKQLDDANKKTHKCSVCAKVFPKPSRLTRHVETVHEGLKPFACTLCDSKFSEKNKMQKHLMTVHHKNVVDSEPNELKKKTVQKCSICDKIFSKPSQLNKHIEAVHEGLKPFACTLCDSKFSYRNKLQRHVVTVHEGKKPYLCSTCGTGFRDQNDLNRHIERIHDGLKLSKLPKDELFFTKFAEKHRIEKHSDSVEPNNGMVESDEIEIDKSLEDSALDGKENKEEEDYVYECPACKTVLSTKRSKFYHQKGNGKVKCESTFL